MAAPLRAPSILSIARPLRPVGAFHAGAIRSTSAYRTDSTGGLMPIRTLHARRSPAFTIARLTYEPLTAPLIVVRERLVAAPCRAIEVASWSLDPYVEARAE